MSATVANEVVPTTRKLVVDSFTEEAGIWLFVCKTLLAYYITGWLAMRLALPQPSTAMLTTIIVANRQSGMVLAKSFYRGIGTLAGAVVAFLIVGLFPQQRGPFLIALSLWVGLCAGGATLHRSFKSYGFVLAGYTAAIVAIPVIDHPPAVFDSAVARISEVLLGLLVSGVVNDTVFPSRMRDVLRQTARAQFANFIGFVQRSTGGSVARDVIQNMHLRFVRDAVTLEDLRSSVVFEDADARARSGHMLLLNQRFMAASTSFQSLHHLINRLQRSGEDAVARALIELYAPIGIALDAPIEEGAAARVLLPRLVTARHTMDALAPTLRDQLGSDALVRDFDTGATLLCRFTDELHAYVDTIASLQAPELPVGSIERVRFTHGTDFRDAGLATLRTTLTMLALGAFWIGSAWPMGASAMLIATIFAGLFATRQNPTQAVGALAGGYAMGMSAAFFCLFFVLTKMDGYGLFVAGSAPFLIVGLLMMMWPSVAGVGLGYSMGFVYILTVKNQMTFDPVNFINEAIAQVVGVSASAIAFVVVPPAIGSRWLRRRQLERLRRQVGLAAKAPLPGLRHRFESVNHDLFSQIVAQTVLGSNDSRSLLAWALAVHETGRALIELRNDMLDAKLPAGVSRSIDLAIEALARFYEAPGAAGHLLARDTLTAAIAAVSEHTITRPLLDHLQLIRMGLLDRDSALVEYMPAAPAATEIDHAS
jgi:uncharacterized membrane protein YccC